MIKPSTAINLSEGYIATFRRRLLRWFRLNKRDLPWRVEPREPYRVWLAEVMLQQTQVATVIPYYERWLQRFPTLQSVAMASQDQVLKQWQGLGYYARARNLHNAMQIVLQDFDGIIPTDAKNLLKLPGIGRYTAGAILSLAYKKPAAILDGNIARVFSRVFAIESDIKSSHTIKTLWTLSEWLVSHKHSDKFNEALMDLGALVCMPLKVNCSICPLSLFCIAYAKGQQLRYPRKDKARVLPTKQYVTLVLLQSGSKLLIAQRPRHGLLGGLWEFPSCELEAGHSLEMHALADTLSSGIKAVMGLQYKIRARHFIGAQKHTFTHFRAIRHIALARSHRANLPEPSLDTYINYCWATVDELKDLSLARDDLRILDLVVPQIGAASPGKTRLSSMPNR